MRKTSSSGRPRISEATPIAKSPICAVWPSVPEVDDRGDPTIVVEQDVVEIQVAMHDVRPKPRPPRRDVRLVAIRARTRRDGAGCDLRSLR